MLDKEIGLAGLESLESLKVDNIEPQKFFLLSVGHGMVALPSSLQKTAEVPQDQHMDRIVDFTLVIQHQVPSSRTVQKTVEVSTVPVEVIDVHSSTLDSPLRELSVQSHLVQQKQHLRRQIRLTATLQCTRSPVTSVFFANPVYASRCCVGRPSICSEPP